MIKPSQPEIERRVAALVTYFEKQADGEYLAWDRIEAESGESMRLPGPGRDYVRRALQRLKRRYEPTRGEGITLSCADNALRIVESRFVQIDRTVKRADRTQKDLSTRHLAQMTSRDQQRMSVVAGFFGAIRTFVAAKKAEGSQ